MSAFDIMIYPENCTGCRRCQLACSFQETGGFQPDAAVIRIIFTENERSIEIQDGCKGCGACANSCLYGALEKQRKKEAS
jgi:carbon-monoxide dehydrogenase iron sulfur subunit